MSVRGAVRRATEWLRGYFYDPRTHNYSKIGAKGFVKRDVILKKLDASLAQRQDTIMRHVDDLANGRLKGNTYLALQKRMVKQQALQQAALAAGGWDRLTPSDRGRVGQACQMVYKAQAQMVKGVLDGTISPAQATQRVHMAMGTIRTASLKIDQAHMPPAKQGKVRLEIRDAVNDKGTCEDCSKYHNQGYQPEGELPRPGEQCQCLGNCRCAITSVEVTPEEAAHMIGHR